MSFLLFSVALLRIKGKAVARVADPRVLTIKVIERSVLAAQRGRVPMRATVFRSETISR